MSASPASAIGAPALPLPGGPPTLAASVEPAFVRNGSSAVKNAYKEAVGFEEMLVEQLSKSLSQTGGLGEGGSEGGEGEGEEGGGSMSLVSSMLPQTLAESLTRGGGLGLATQLTTAIDPSAIDQAAPAAGKAGA
jgi:Rod binding domain-containing protein